MTHARTGGKAGAAKTKAPPRRGGASQLSSCSSRGLEPEADAADTGEVVVLNIAVGDAALGYRVHDADVGIPLRQEPPVENRRVHLVSAGALAVGAGDGADAHAAHVLVLEVFIVGADDVQVAGDAVFGADPKDLEDLIPATGTGAAQGVERIVIDRRQIGGGNDAVVNATGIVESEAVIDE